MFATSEQMMFQCPSRPMPMERKWTTKVEIAPNCPRCASSNTKFCYYNNYSLSQPRYFCKGCRRYWTKGGSLRNVPVGGGCRKYRRTKSSRVSRSEPAVSFNYSRNSNAFDTDTDGSSAGACSTTVSQQSGGNGSDIDLAVVFAKFLNQNPSREPDTILAEEELSSKADELADVYNIPLTQLSGQNDAMTECQKLSSLMQEFDLLEEQSQVQFLGKKEQQETSVQEFISSDMNSFGLQTLLSDQVLQDALWSDDVAIPMLQLQDLDPFSLDMDHQLKISASSNSSNDCSSLDFSGLDGFSRP